MLTRVPLVVHAPFVAEPARARVVGELVQLFDIVATTLEFASITPQHVHFSRSLAPYLSSAAPPANFTPRAFVFSEGGYATNEPRDHEGAWVGLPNSLGDDAEQPRPLPPLSLSHTRAQASSTACPKRVRSITTRRRSRSTRRLRCAAPSPCAISRTS